MIGSLVINYIRVCLCFTLFVPFILYRANKISEIAFYLSLVVVALVVLMFFKLKKKTLLILLACYSLVLIVLNLITLF